MIFVFFAPHRKNWPIASLAHLGFDPRTFGLWAQHASSAPVSNWMPFVTHQQTLSFILYYRLLLHRNKYHNSDQTIQVSAHSWLDDKSFHPQKDYKYDTGKKGCRALNVNDNDPVWIWIWCAYYMYCVHILHMHICSHMKLVKRVQYSNTIIFSIVSLLQMSW